MPRARPPWSWTPSTAPTASPGSTFPSPTAPACRPSRAAFLRRPRLIHTLSTAMSGHRRKSGHLLPSEQIKRLPTDEKIKAPRFSLQCSRCGSLSGRLGECSDPGCPDNSLANSFIMVFPCLEGLAVGTPTVHGTRKCLNTVLQKVWSASRQRSGAWFWKRRGPIRNGRAPPCKNFAPDTGVRYIHMRDGKVAASTKLRTPLKAFFSLFFPRESSVKRIAPRDDSAHSCSDR